MLGALVVWSGQGPRLDAIRLPHDGVVLGRDHADPTDEAISHTHARVTEDAGVILIEDLGSRNGTFVNGRRIDRTAHDPTLPLVIRTGRTVSLIVPDIERYEGAALARRDKLVVGGSLANALSILDRAALEESHLGIVGPMSVGRQLARIYADIVGGNTCVVDLEVTSLSTFVDKLAGATPRTMILELDRPLTLPDRPELEQWLETDVRIVSVARGWESYGFMPKELVRRLTPRAIELPQQRFDELPMTVADRVIARAPTATVHATLAESALLHIKHMNEDALMRALDDAITAWLGRNQTMMRGQDLDEHIAGEAAMRNCVQGLRRRR